MISLSLSFVILIFFLSIGTAVVAGLISMLLYKQLDYFLEIFKPGFAGGSIGILLILIIGHLFETDINQTSIYNLFWILPIVLTTVGLALGTVSTYRKKQKQLKF